MEKERTTSEAVMVDTDIFIDCLRKVSAAKDFLNETQDRLFFSALTETELLAGDECDDSAKRESLLHFLSLFTKLPVNNSVALAAGDFRRKYRIPTPNCIIAATAYLHKMILYTRDKHAFETIREIRMISPY